jgi:hypothetical protein
MHTVLAVQLRVELLLATNLQRIEEHRGTLGSRRNVTVMFNHNPDRRYLINLSFGQFLLPMIVL